MKLKYMLFALFSVCLTFIAGCGGGGDSTPATTQPTLVTLKLATTGTLPAATTIGGFTVTVTANPSTGLTIADADVTASGAGVGATLVPNTASVSNVVVTLASGTGIQTGEFATLKYHVAAGSFPAAGNFTVVLNGVVNDANIPAQAIGGIGVAKLSTTIQ